MKKQIAAALLALAACAAHAQVQWVLKVRGDAAELGTFSTQTACDDAARARATPGAVVYECPRYLRVVSPETSCPAPASQTVACPAGFTGNYTQTRTAPPACAWTPTTPPAGACTAVPPAGEWTRVAVEGQSFTVPDNTTVRYGAGTSFVQRVLSGQQICSNSTFGSDPAREIVKACDSLAGGSTTPPVDPPPTGEPVTLHFSPSGVDSQPGTQAAPKRNLTSSIVASVAPGSMLLMQCGVTHTMSGSLNIRNAGARDATRVTIDGYGDCTTTPAVLSFPANTVAGIEFGRYNDSRAHEGYTIRNLRLVRAASTNEGWGVYMSNDLRKVTLQGLSFAGWTTNIYAQGGHRTREILTQDNDLRGFVGGHGVLGRFTNSHFLYNVSEPGATGMTHAFYLSEGSGNVLRGNRILKQGSCSGGGITMHSGYTTGQGEPAPKPIDGVVLEDNEFDYSEAPANSCYAVSLSPYESAPAPGGFANVVVRNNRITRASTSINVVAAPGALIEGNVITDSRSTAISYRNYTEDPADLAGPGTVRNNTLCRSSGIVAPAGSTVTGNVSACP